MEFVLDNVKSSRFRWFAQRSHSFKHNDSEISLITNNIYDKTMMYIYIYMCVKSKLKS